MKSIGNGLLAVAIVIVWTGLAGCAQPKVIPSTGVHAPTRPEQVKFYGKQPAEYEELGLVTLEITPGLGWDERGEANAAFDKLREKAAALGATGVLFVVPPESFQLNATAGYKGTFYQVPMRNNPRTAVAQAIFVHKE